MNYIELNIDFLSVDPWREIVVTYLSDLEYESFTESQSNLSAYIQESLFDEEKLTFLEEFKAHIKGYSHKVIQDRNWNEEWEKNFDPVYVGEELAILAPFHDANTPHQLKIFIKPQMSFGTGHHETTWLASKRLLSLDMKGKTVLDMGTGTGILAILAEKLGADKVFAPDIDEWSYHNAIENCDLNNCSKIEVALGTDQLIKNKRFDIIIANINKNILIQQFGSYSEAIHEGGTLLISGFFKTDVSELVEVASKYGFIFEKDYQKDEWALVEFVKN